MTSAGNDSFSRLEQLSLQRWGYHPIVNLFAEQTGFPRDENWTAEAVGIVSLLLQNFTVCSFTSYES